ncbi:MAG: hypothetical protein Pg6C_15120 [Treponemataceae bacterium]|nr:MAG: hypothetical protein Pg6C_15120 [Treponemataceae bacterium]
MKRRLSWRLPVLVGVVVLVFSSAGCASMVASLENWMYEGVETAQSKKFLDGANDILTQSRDGYMATQFKALFEKKFSGITWNGSSVVSLDFTYKETKYKMQFEQLYPGWGARSPWATAKSCTDMTPPKK